MENLRRMTGEERAEKIFRDICYGYSDTRLRGDAPECVKDITDQIKQAESEARAATNEEWQNILPPQFEIARKEGYAKGFASARERAAKIARDFEETLFSDRGQLEKIEWVLKIRETQRKKITERIKAMRPASEEK